MATVAAKLRSVYLATGSVAAVSRGEQVLVPVRNLARWKVGDRAWVRELWRASGESHHYQTGEANLYVSYHTHVRWVFGHSQKQSQWAIGPEFDVLARKAWGRVPSGRWRSPMHMPYWASRFTVEVVDLDHEQRSLVVRLVSAPKLRGLPAPGVRDACRS